MPFKANSRTSLRNSQRFNPLNSSPSIAKAHVYEDPVLIHEPPTKGGGRYYRKSKQTQDI